MRVFRRKLIISFIALAMIVVCLTSTTYAWFARNSYAVINSFDINIENPQGLLISVDGKTFYQRISRDDILRAAVAKREGLDVDDAKLNKQYVDDQFLNYFRLTDVTTNDLTSFMEVDPIHETNGYYNFKAADDYHYLKFDLYFKNITDKNDASVYDVAFVPAELTESLGVGASYITSEAVTGTFATPFSTLEKDYKADEEIIFNPANAMRVGLYNLDREASYVYEPNQGTSSYALDGGEGRYNPYNNIAFQYLNAYARYQLAPLKKTEADKFDYENTFKVFDDTQSLGAFENENKEGYNIIKLEMSIWLEGFDGDYIGGTGVSLKPVTCYFSFYKKIRK